MCYDVCFGYGGTGKKQINNNQPINQKKPKRGQAEASRVKDGKIVSDQK